MASEPYLKLTWLSIQATEHEKELIELAARAVGSTVNRFILQRAYEGAQAVLADHFRFRLSDKNWQAFCRTLDAPPTDIPALRELLNEPSMFDE